MAYPMTIPSRFHRFIPVAALTLLFFCFVLKSAYGRGMDGAESLTPNTAKPNSNSRPSTGNVERDIEMSLDDIANATLGFDRVFAIGLRDRMDKRDSMTIGAALTGIDLEWVDGVHRNEMSEKSYPASWEKRLDKLPELAAWRAHMNVLQRIVAEKIPTALVFEDDIDWDVSIKAQLRQFAYGARALQNTTSPTHSPYGNNWDVLWLGGCGGQSKDSSRFYVIPDDPTVAPTMERIGHEILKPDISGWEDMENTRFVLDYADVACSLAYAVTYESALRTLTKWSLEPNKQPFDNDLRELCDPINRHGFYLRCIAPYPLLFGHYRKEGPEAAGSDIKDLGDSWHKAYSHGIVYSTMLNAKNLTNGGTVAKAQYPGFQPPEMALGNVQLPRGHLETGGD